MIKIKNEEDFELLMDRLYWHRSMKRSGTGREKRWVLDLGPFSFIYDEPEKTGIVINTKSRNPKDTYDLLPWKKEHKELAERIKREGKLVWGKRYRITKESLENRKPDAKIEYETESKPSFRGFQIGSSEEKNKSMGKGRKQLKLW